MPPGLPHCGAAAGAAAARAIETFAKDQQDAVLVAAADYARSHPLSSRGLVYDNHIAAVTGGAADVKRWREERGLGAAAVAGPNEMRDGTHLLDDVDAGVLAARVLTLREFIAEVATTYDRSQGMSYPAQGLLRAADRHLVTYAPVGYRIVGGRGIGTRRASTGRPPLHPPRRRSLDEARR